VAVVLVLLEIMVLLVVLEAVHGVGLALLEVLELLDKDSWEQTRLEGQVVLVEVVQAVVVLVQQALQTQTLLEQQAGQVHPHQFLVQALLMLVAVAEVAALPQVRVERGVLVAVVLEDVMQLTQLQAQQIQAAEVAVLE
jgi:hypothetical protein